MHVLFSPLTTVLLLLAIFQPMLDHHYAERVPGHTHLVLNGGVLALQTSPISHRTHRYEHPHTHTPSPAGGPASADADRHVAAVVIPLAGGIGAAPTLIEPWLPPTADYARSEGFTLLADRSATFPSSHTVAPSVPPPVLQSHVAV